MTFLSRVFPTDSYAADAAHLIASKLSREGSLVVTGGGTAAAVYPALDVDLSRVQVFFSDERCVPPDDPASNFRMVEQLLLGRTGATDVHRMRGEDSPVEAAQAYHDALVPVVKRGFDQMLLGMGDDNHIAALWPNSAALMKSDALCLPVDRPDGLKGLTMTPSALAAARSVLLLVTGGSKAEAVARAITGDEDALRCPARLFADHPDATFILDEAAAARL